MEHSTSQHFNAVQVTPAYAAQWLRELASTGKFGRTDAEFRSVLAYIWQHLDKWPDLYKKDAGFKTFVTRWLDLLREVPAKQSVKSQRWWSVYSEIMEAPIKPPVERVPFSVPVDMEIAVLNLWFRVYGRGTAEVRETTQPTLAVAYSLLTCTRVEHLLEILPVCGVTTAEFRELLELAQKNMQDNQTFEKVGITPEWVSRHQQALLDYSSDDFWLREDSARSEQVRALLLLWLDQCYTTVWPNHAW